MVCSLPQYSYCDKQEITLKKRIYTKDTIKAKTPEIKGFSRFFAFVSSNVLLYIDTKSDLTLYIVRSKAHKTCIPCILTIDKKCYIIRKEKIDEEGGNLVIRIGSDAYEALLGNIGKEALSYAASCIGQCTGCMCNCRCSCSGGCVSDFEWEVI